ncbi:hypothetical protein FOZ62_002054, partial [Perkinsus olseni]
RDTNYKPDAKQLVWSQGNVHGFTRHLATSSNLVTEFVDSESGSVLKSFSIPARSQPRVSTCPHCESPVLKQEDLAGVIRASLSPRMPNMNVSIYIVIAIVARGFANLTRKQLRKQQKLGLDKPVGQETKLVESDWKDAWTENLPRWAQKRRDYVDRIQIPASWKWWGVLSLTPLLCA